MKKLLPFIFGVLCFVSCRDEKDVDPAKTATFLRFFGSEHSHTAVLAMEADNGYALLSNIDIPVDNLGDFRYKIRFIHTDIYGNILWNKEYPGFKEVVPDTLDGFSSSSFINLSDGYLVIGDRIYTNGDTQLQLLKIGLNGEVGQSVVLSSSPGTSLHGRAVTIDGSGDFIVLGNITGHPSNDMYIAKIDAQTFAKEWSQEYGSGEGTVVNRLFVNSSSNITWGGSVRFNSSFDVRLINSPENSLNTKLDNLIGDPLKNETVVDFCQTLGGFVFVGSTESADGDQDIYFTKISETAIELVTPDEPIDFDGLNDKAVSVTPGLDGGYMILATVESGTTKGNGREDYLLLKVDDRGEYSWEINYGGADREEGASVRTTSDGAYLVFGTTYFGEMKKLMLMKVGENGKF